MSLLPGLLLAAALAALAWGLAQTAWALAWGLSALPLAIVLGIVGAHTVFAPLSRRCGPGVEVARTRLLRIGIVLFGLRLGWAQLAQVGWSGLLIDLVMFTSTFALALWLGIRILRLEPATAVLIGSGAAVCGAAAVLASEPVVRASPAQVAVSVATVVAFGTLAMFVYPLMYPLLGLGEHAYGLYVGSTVHEVAQVVAAGRSISETAAATAVIEKMLRVMLLAPFLLLLAWGWRRWADGGRRHGSGQATQSPMGRAPAQPRTPLVVPWFAIGFVAASGVQSLGWLPAAWVSGLAELGTALLATAMAALGLRTHVSVVRRAGVRPLLLAAGLFVHLTVGGYLVNRALA